MKGWNGYMKDFEQVKQTIKGKLKIYGWNIVSQSCLKIKYYIRNSKIEIVRTFMLYILL